MSLHTKFHWIFDLDGTLTVPIHDFESIRKELNVPAGNDILYYIEALSGKDAAICRRRLQQIELELARQAVPSAGAVEMIEILFRIGARLGILTRNDKSTALLTLETIGLRGFFDEKNILGRNEAIPKPDPAGINQLLAGWGADPSDAVMVGDYIFDLQAGRAAGTVTVHVAHGEGERWPEFTDYAIGSLDELTGCLLPVESCSYESSLADELSFCD